MYIYASYTAYIFMYILLPFHSTRIYRVREVALDEGTCILTYPHIVESRQSVSRSKRQGRLYIGTLSSSRQNPSFPAFGLST